MTKQKSILLADDDQFVRECYSEIIEKDFSKYNLETFENGTLLKGRLEENVENVGVVITDNQMPGVTGGEIIEKYAKSEKFSKIPFILHYGGAQHIGERAVENGACAYLLKPASLEEFTQMLKMVLDDSGNF